MRPEEAAEQRALKKERDEALRAIGGAARFLSVSRQRALNGWLRALVEKIQRVREQDARGSR